MDGDIGNNETPIRLWDIPAIAKFFISHAGEIPEFLPLLKEAIEALMVAENKVKQLQDLVSEYYRQRNKGKRGSRVSEDGVASVFQEQEVDQSLEQLKTVEVTKKRKHSKHARELGHASEVPHIERSLDENLGLLTENILINTFVGNESGGTSETASTVSDVSFKTPKKKKKKRDLKLTDEPKGDGDVGIQTGSAPMQVPCQSPVIRVIPSARLIKTPPSPDLATSRENLLTREAGSEQKTRVYFEFDSEVEQINSDDIAAAFEELELKDFEILSVEHSKGITTSTVEFASKKFYRVFFSKQLVVNGFAGRLRTCGLTEEVKVKDAEAGSADEAIESHARSTDPALQVAPNDDPLDTTRVNAKDEVPQSGQRQNHGVVADRLNRINEHREYDLSRNLRDDWGSRSDREHAGYETLSGRRRRKVWRKEIPRERDPEVRSGRHNIQSPGEKVINRYFSELSPKKHPRQMRNDVRNEKKRQKEGRKGK